MANSKLSPVDSATCGDSPRTNYLPTHLQSLHNPKLSPINQNLYEAENPIRIALIDKVRLLSIVNSQSIEEVMIRLLLFSENEIEKLNLSLQRSNFDKNKIIYETRTELNNSRLEVSRLKDKLKAQTDSYNFNAKFPCEKLREQLRTTKTNLVNSEKKVKSEVQESIKLIRENRQLKNKLKELSK